MKLFLLLLPLLFIFFLIAEEKEVNIPAKSKTIQVEKTQTETVLGASPEEIKKCEENDKYSPIAFFWSGTLIVSVAVLLLFVLLVAKQRLAMNEKALIKKFGNLSSPLKTEIAKKNQEIAILKATMTNKSEIDSLTKEIAQLTRTIEEKNKTIGQLTTQISLNENPKSSISSIGASTEEIIKNQKEEIEMLSKEKMEFLEMIENLQKQLSDKKSSDNTAPASSNTLSQNELNDLIANSGYEEKPSVSKFESHSQEMLEEVLNGKSGGVTAANVLSQEDLDALISGISSKPADPAQKKEEPKGALSQDDLDALFK